MKLKELCNREVVVVYAHESIVDAAKLMKRYNVDDIFDLITEEQMSINGLIHTQQHKRAI